MSFNYAESVPKKVIYNGAGVKKVVYSDKVILTADAIVEIQFKNGNLTQYTVDVPEGKTKIVAASSSPTVGSLPLSVSSVKKIFVTCYKSGIIISLSDKDGYVIAMSLTLGGKPQGWNALAFSGTNNVNITFGE